MYEPQYFQQLLVDLPMHCLREFIRQVDLTSDWFDLQVSLSSRDTEYALVASDPKPVRPASGLSALL